MSLNMLPFSHQQGLKTGARVDPEKKAGRAVEWGKETTRHELSMG